MNKGTIFKALSGFYYVESDNIVYECKARGRFRLEKKSPLVGDYVEFKTTEPGRGVVTGIFPRKNEFMRPPVANIDSMVIIASGAAPVTDPYIIDKMTVIATRNNCESIVCINKCDLDPADELYDIYNSSGFKTIKTSAKTGMGIPELIEAIKDSICAFSGNSGVGKSSILNTIDANFKIKVGNVSNKLGRGRHTTRHVELYKLSCGTLVADTPGFSAFDLKYIAPKEDLQFFFRDFAPYLEACRFQDCAHINEPDCTVLDALKAGKIKKSRYDSYIRLYNQASNYKHWESTLKENQLR